MINKRCQVLIADGPHSIVPNRHKEERYCGDIARLLLMATLTNFTVGALDESGVAQLRVGNKIS